MLGAAQLSDGEQGVPFAAATGHASKPARKVGYKPGYKLCNLCNQELDCKSFDVLASGALRSYCVQCHPLVFSWNRKGLRVADLRAAYQAGSLDSLLKDDAPSHRGSAAAGEDLLRHKITHGNSESMEFYDPGSDELSEGGFE